MRVWRFAFATAATLVGCVPLDGLSGGEQEPARRETPPATAPSESDPATSPSHGDPATNPSPGAPAESPTPPSVPPPNLLAHVDFESPSQQTFAGFLYSRAPLAEKYSGSVGTTTRTVLPVPFTATNEVYASFRFRLDANPPSDPTIFEVLDTDGRSQLRFELGVSNNGLKVFRANDRDYVDENPPLLVGSTYRIGIHIKGGPANKLEVTLAQSTGAPIVIVDDSLAAATSPFTKLQLGNLSGQLLSATFDDIMVSAKPLP